MKRFVFFTLILTMSAFATQITETVAPPAPPKFAAYADLGFFTEARENQGSGFGFGIETIFAKHFGLRGRHGIVSRTPGNTITHIVTSVAVTFYPKSEGLEGFNAGLGIGFINTQIVRNPAPFYNQIFPFIDACFGYKFVIWRRLVIEPYINWLMLTKDSDLAVSGIHQVVDTVGLTLGVVF